MYGLPFHSSIQILGFFKAINKAKWCKIELRIDDQEY